MADTPDKTAVGPMTIVAIDQHEAHPLLVDPLAYKMLPAAVKPIVGLTRWRWARHAMIKALDKQASGMWAAFLCRKRYVDDTLRQALDADVRAVVVLGAGFDTVAYRTAELRRKVPVYEVDLPVNIERKHAVLTKVFGRVPGGVLLVPIDFGTQDLNTVLSEHGYHHDQKTFFVWEAVTQYLTEQSVDGTMRALADASPGSRLVFTYVRKELLDGTAFFGAQALHREYVTKRRLWHFGLNPDQVEEFLARYGFRSLEQPQAEDLRARYVAPTGRGLGVSEAERSVLAEKL